jgi:hypothetical protein
VVPLVVLRTYVVSWFVPKYPQMQIRNRGVDCVLHYTGLQGPGRGYFALHGKLVRCHTVYGSDVKTDRRQPQIDRFLAKPSRYATVKALMTRTTWQHKGEWWSHLAKTTERPIQRATAGRRRRAINREKIEVC